MFKWIANAWMLLGFVWKYVNPIYTDLMRIIKAVKDSGLTDEAARKKVFQDITDCFQARGLEKYPDSVLNAAIEMGYQIYLWKIKK